ncbi:MAG TPA: DUF2332 domain-containing protein [Nocardioidaceae bacterium]|nr:DUF2332 domain-containing protein [Nocardioidaceae bacterium]
MAGVDELAAPSERLRRQASHHRGDLYGHLMLAMADDYEAGGPVAAVYRGHERAPSGSLLSLRVLAGLFRLVLTGRAQELARFYPCLGGTADPAEAWPAVREVMAAHVPELRAALDVPPQTNEVGRSRALLVGVCEAVRRTGRRRVRLFEVGASAGLNLLVDQIRFETASWSLGPPDSPLVLRDGFEGDFQPARFDIVSRRGCDRVPVDVSSPEGRLRLRSFVWPWQVARHQSLTAALELALRAGSRLRQPVNVEPADAGAWLERVFDALPEPGDPAEVCVVWHSITRLYWEPAEQARAAAAIAAARSRRAVVEVAMEYPQSAPGAPTGWPAELTVDGDRLGTVGDHGIPVRLDRR